MTMNTKEHLHTLNLSKAESGSDEGTVAQLVVTNAVNGEPYLFDVRSDNPGAINVASSIICHSNPSKIEYFCDGFVEELLSDNLENTLLGELVCLADKTVQIIEESYETGDDFSFEYGPSEMVNRFDLHYIIVNEELARLMIKAEERTLTIGEIIDFGKLVEVDTDTYEGDAGYFYLFFEEVVKKAQQNKPLNEEESKYVNIAFNYLNFNDEDECNLS
ncbi:hypothetical protein [Priestia megaterium]|uniref:Uncharacterized protein n=1 Tax=Priestia megaterium TaxID=1404 RepID=A0A6M6E0F4_PRIMG|nr:hypothetical protein [Priestia megaterium]QJX80320.1 hypothetical protein FDZ14_29965 [Priestia megaterium]